MARLFFALLLATNFVNPANGFELGNNLAGAFGEASNKVKTEADRLAEESGVTAAAEQARLMLLNIAQGAVPVIDELADPYQARAEAKITSALEKSRLATDILREISEEGARRAIDFITTSPLFDDADFGFSTPTGRFRIYRRGLEVSLCRTIVSPFGTVIITGISNSKRLCNFPDARMANPTGSLLGFTYIAAGHTHIRVNRIILVNPTADLTLLPAPITAETYVQTPGDQWVQIRLAGTDPASIEIEAKFEVGLKGNVSYVVDAEVEGEAALKVSLKPVYAAEVIRSTGEAMFDRATALGADMEAGNFAENATEILRAGLLHLSDIEPQYEEGFGDVILDVKITGCIGVGAWDTAISGLSANATFNLTYPLHGLIEWRAGLLEEYLDIALGMVNANRILGTAVLEGNIGTGLDAYESELRRASTDFVTGVMDEMLEASAVDGFSITSSFKMSLLGDADKESTDVYYSSLTVPVGVLSASLQANPNAFGDAYPPFRCC